jgi:hypothetical protein
MSKPEVKFTPPTDAAVDELIANMREQDVAEVYAAGHSDLRKVVEEGVRISRWSLAARIDGELACIFGLAVRGSALTPLGVPWLLGTPLVPKHRRVLARLAPRYIQGMLQTAPRLLNTVHARNTVAVQWLKRMGFRLHEPFAAPTGEMFHLFEMGTARV